jgi:glycine cleavage system aminomethyltransferase T
VTGKDRDAFIEHVTVADMASLAQGRGMYSFIPNAKGTPGRMVGRRF